jgi:hypothetical protein
MERLTLAIVWLCLSAMPAFAQSTNLLCLPIVDLLCHRSAPAPLIGLGLPVVLAVGGVLLGARLLKRKRSIRLPD